MCFKRRFKNRGGTDVCRRVLGGNQRRLTSAATCGLGYSKHALNRAGLTLIEMIFAMGITALLALTICGFSIYSSRNFVAISNYSELDTANRLAMDTLTSDVRQANYVFNASTNFIILNSPDPNNLSLNGFITYSYNPTAGTLVRLENFPGSTKRTVLLTGCDRLEFSLGQRNATTNGVPFKGMPFSSPSVIQNTAKVIDVSWLCSRKILGIKVNTESVQTARVVIRKQTP